MNDLIAAFIASVVIGCLLLIGPLFGSVFGAVVGWIVGIFFGDTILLFFSKIGITGMSMWQIGCSLGFISGFVKSTQTNNNKS